MRRARLPLLVAVLSDAVYFYRLDGIAFEKGSVPNKLILLGALR